MATVVPQPRRAEGCRSAYDNWQPVPYWDSFSAGYGRVRVEAAGSGMPSGTLFPTRLFREATQQETVDTGVRVVGIEPHRAEIQISAIGIVDR